MCGTVHPGSFSAPQAACGLRVVGGNQRGFMCRSRLAVGGKEKHTGRTVSNTIPQPKQARTCW
jgi:hypothetical protein